MRAGKLTYFILLVGIASLIFSNIFEKVLSRDFRDSNGKYKWNIISAHVNNILDTGGSNSFSIPDMDFLKENTFKNRDLAYSTECQTTAVYRMKSAKVNLFGVSSKYDKFHNIKLKAGGFLNVNNQHDSIAVIDEAAAQQIFGSNNVVGMYISLYGKKFRIIGVAENKTTLLNTLSDNGYGNIYIECSQLLSLNSNARITTLDVKTTDSSTIGKNSDELNSALSSIGKNPSNYNITDLNVEKALIEQKSELSIFIAGMVFIIIILLKAIKILKNIHRIMADSLKEHYLSEVISLKSGVLLYEIVKILILFILIALVWHKIKFNLYIPGECIPADPTDTTFFWDLFKSKIQASLQNEGYIRTQMEIKLSITRSLVDKSFYISLFSGLPLIYTAYYQYKILKERI